VIGAPAVPRTPLGLVGWRLALLPPLAAVLAGAALALAVAAYGGYDPLGADTWSRWDSLIYQDIAQHGYTSRPCPQWEIDDGARACGTFGWFPLYPAAMAPLVSLGVAPWAAGVLVAIAFWVAALVVIWNGLLLALGGRAALAALGLAAFGPGAFYLHLVYPVSMTVCLLAVALVCLRRERWLGAGIAGGLAAASHPGAMALIPVAGLWLAAIVPAPTLVERARRIALVCGLTAAGFAAVLLYAELSTGQWDGYFGVQARFDHGVHLPFANWLDLSTPRFEGLGNISIFIALQSWFTTLLVAIVVATTWARRATATPFDWLLVLWVLAFWLIPLAQDTVSYYRTDALLLPAAAAFVTLAPRLVWALALAGAAITAGMTLAFMQGVLV